MKWRPASLLILVDENTSQNEIVIVPGACATITDSDIARVEQLIRESTYVLLQLEVNQDANEKVARLAKENGVRVIINTGALSACIGRISARHIPGYAQRGGSRGTDGRSRKRPGQRGPRSEVLLNKGVQNV